MKFGMFVMNQHSLEDNPAERWEEHLEQVRLIRDLGFHSVWCGQHYLTEGVWMMQTWPSVAQVAAHAGDMTVGTGILLLALHNPVDVAEQVATLDAMTKGRFVLGVGLGYREPEYRAFGLAKPYRVKAFEEKLEALTRLLEGETLNYEGEVVQLQDVTLTMRPTQKPRPPIWIAANGDGAVKRAARMSEAWFLNPHARFDTLKRQMEMFHEEREAAGKGAPDATPVIKEMFIGEDRESAFRECADYLAVKYNVYVKWGQSEALPKSDTLRMPLDELRSDRFLIGSAEDVAEDIRRHRDELGVDHMAFRVQWPGMPQELVLRTLERFAKEVMPEFL